MSDSTLPLLPDKGGAVCADVRPVLREVFRELECLPPLYAEIPASADIPVEDSTNQWAQDFNSENTKICHYENELQQEYAKRLSREPLPNIYKLHSPVVSRDDKPWKKEYGILHRKDLKPSVEQNAGCTETLWVKNILNRSSGDVSKLMVTGSRIRLQAPLEYLNEDSIQSYSIGELIPRPPVPPPVEPPPLAPPEYVICIPSRLDFVNFTVGQIHTQVVRLVNVSKFEVRLSVRPPARRALSVTLCSRLTLTAGRSAEMRVQFHPQHVRALRDELCVRVSRGRDVAVPIHCCMQPPILHIQIPNTSTSQPCSSSVQREEELDLGSRLLGNVHRAPLLLRCLEQHAAFFLLTEDAWFSYSIDIAVGSSSKSDKFSVATDCFSIWPVSWCGGGSTGGRVVCRAPRPGLHTAALRLLSSTAAVRPLYLIADSILFNPRHVTIQAQEKDYDICSEDDPGCDYYVNLGGAFPHRSLAASIVVTNHSPVSYNYYWSVRPWGVCSCWRGSQQSLNEEDDGDLCPGAKVQKLLEQKEVTPRLSDGDDATGAVRVSLTRGTLLPRAPVSLDVRVPDAGGHTGVHRAVLMLILKDIPKESLPANYDPMIVSVKQIKEKAIPGVCPAWSREACEVVCAQLEVWWTVEPVRVALHPPRLTLAHSRRVKSVAVPLRTTQLYGTTSVQANWEALTPKPPSPILLPGQSTVTTIMFPLKESPDDTPSACQIRLVCGAEEYTASCRVERRGDARRATLQPARVWLGVAAPGAAVCTDLMIHNHTHRSIQWSCKWYNWMTWKPERCPGRVCPACLSRQCRCNLLRPAAGALGHGHCDKIRFKDNVPYNDGCVVTLIQALQDEGSTASTPASATLVAYRVLAPRLLLRVLPCFGDKKGNCEACALDPGASRSARGTTVLRPSAPMPVHSRACCRLRIANTTPIATAVHWQTPPEGSDILEVTFSPNEFEVDAYSEVETMVVMEAKKVCGRRLFVLSADVTHTSKPLYLIIDAAVTGVEMIVEFPIGGEEPPDSFVTFKMTQKEEIPRDASRRKLFTPEVIFAEEDHKRAVQRENVCHCRYKMIYIPPEMKPLPPADELHPEDYPPVEILEEPPPMTRVCACGGAARPVLPDDVEPYCLQFRHLPTHTVRSRTVVLRNVSQVDARLRCAVRRWPRRHTRTVNREQWRGDVQAPGVVLQCLPASGTVHACNQASIQVSVYADCWGLYHDQILIHIDDLDALVIDVWVEADAPPLQFALSRSPLDIPTLWTSYSDSERSVRATNVSRADLQVYAYVVREHEYLQDVLPFRLYLRLFDVRPPVCPCVTAFETESLAGEESSTSGSSLFEEMDTGVELYLAPDCGIQDDTYYQIEPTVMTLSAGASTAWRVSLRSPMPATAAPSALLLRSEPLQSSGDGWYRAPPPAQVVHLREAPRAPHLKASCAEVRVALCALDLPAEDVLRVRKRFRLQNVGAGVMRACAVTHVPWTAALAQRVCDAHCVSALSGQELQVELLPFSSVEMFVEVSVGARDSWPTPGSTYEPRRTTDGALGFYDQQRVLLLNIPLNLSLDVPALKTRPESIDFGLVSEGDTKKTYFTVSHSSPTASLELVTQVDGSEYRIWPPSLIIPPNTSARVYVQFNARWLLGECAVGAAHIVSRGPAAGWCRATVPLRALPARRALSPPTHADHTDDTHLLPTLI